MNIESLLDQVRKTNPDMTRDKLKEELRKSTSSAAGLVITCRNFMVEEMDCTGTSHATHFFH